MDRKIQFKLINSFAINKDSEVAFLVKVLGDFNVKIKFLSQSMWGKILHLLIRRDIFRLGSVLWISSPVYFENNIELIRYEIEKTIKWKMNERS